MAWLATVESMWAAETLISYSAGLMASLLGVMQATQLVAVMSHLHARCWSQRRIFRQLGISCYMVSLNLAHW